MVTPTFQVLLTVINWVGQYMKMQIEMKIKEIIRHYCEIGYTVTLVFYLVQLTLLNIIYKLDKCTFTHIQCLYCTVVVFMKMLFVACWAICMFEYAIKML